LLKKGAVLRVKRRPISDMFNIRHVCIVWAALHR